jgi:hypothetical protein
MAANIPGGLETRSQAAPSPDMPPPTTAIFI